MMIRTLKGLRKDCESYSLRFHSGLEHEDKRDGGSDDDRTPTEFTGGKHDDQHPHNFTNVF